MQMQAPSVAELVAKAVVCLAVMLPFITAPIIVLRKKDCAAEINVIWYAFSLVFVLWWCLHLAMNLNIVRMPIDEAPLSALRKQVADLKSHLANDVLTQNKFDHLPPAIDEKERIDQLQQKSEDHRRAEDDLRRAESELRRKIQEGEPWSARFVYQKAKEYLTDTHAELGLVATILIVTIVPQFLNYILAGFAGCAATPRLVWQFEKIATWSLIKFLAAFGGVSVADALGIYAIDTGFDPESILSDLDGYVDALLWGMGAVGLAFVVTVFQVYTLEAAHALGDAWPKKPKSWPYVVHRFFTRNLPPAENKPGEEAEPEGFDPRQIWDKLTPSQQQEVGALVVRSLLDGRLAANAVSRS